MNAIHYALPAAVLIILCVFIWRNSKAGYFHYRRLSARYKRLLEYHWMAALHICAAPFAVALFVNATFFGNEDAIRHFITLAAFYVAGTQAALAFQFYKSSTKRQMRQASIEHAKFAIDAFRKKERDLLLAFANANSNKIDATSHPLHAIVQTFDLTLSPLTKQDVRNKMTAYGRKMTTPALDYGDRNEFFVPRDLASIFAKSPVLSALIREMLMPYEMLALGVMRNSFGFITIDGLMGPHVVDVFLRWYPFIRAGRREPGHSGMLDCFQFLASCIVHHRTDISLGIRTSFKEVGSQKDARRNCSNILAKNPIVTADCCNAELPQWASSTRSRWAALAQKKLFFPDITHESYERRGQSELCYMLDRLYYIDNYSGMHIRKYDYARQPALSNEEWRIRSFRARRRLVAHIAGSPD